MNEKLSKEIMKRSRLRSKFLNTKSDLDRKAYNKQKNISLLRKEKKEFYGKLNTNVLTESRTFWKSAKSFLAEKSKRAYKITLIEDNQIISQNKQNAKIFNEYFIKIPIFSMTTNHRNSRPEVSCKKVFLKILQNF